MKKVVKKFGCKNEELPTIGQFIYESFKRDKADFSPYTDFDPPFESNFGSELQAVNLLVNPVTFTLEMKKVTFTLYTNIFGLRGMMDDLQNYVNNAGNTLTVLPKDFGFKAVRADIKRLDVEGLNNSLNTLETNITNNFTALKAKGYTQEKFDALKTMHASILTDNGTQNLLTDAKEEQTENNMNYYNSFYEDFVGKTANQGKLIYKTKKPSKVNDYTIAALVRRIRQEQLRSGMDISVKDANGNAVVKGDVVAKPVVSGRTRKGKMLNGVCAIKSMVPGDYNLFVTVDGVTKIVQVTVPTGEMVSVEVVV